MSGDRKALLALAERVEKASGPDRELDAEILAALVGGTVVQSPFNMEWCVYVGTERNGRPKLWQARTEQENAWRTAAFTSSLDAARTLVPEGWRVYSADWSIPGVFSWTLKGPCTRYVKGPDGYDEAGDDWHVSGSASLPELALVAACLRALASAAPGGGA